ncbi:MAG TPA: protealysin inhibitor emfourin [Propionibacteriaceae bacterium]|nr:protealysin inhibitor emfourin [Propionibacteriaceae bacterium]
MTSHPLHCQFVPPWLLEHIAEPGDARTMAVDTVTEAVTHTLRTDEQIRAARAGKGKRPPRPAAKAAWAVYTASSTQNLPGTLMRTAGDPDSTDVAVNEAATGGQAALDMYSKVYGRDSYDGKGAEVVMSVHYGQRYDNAFWNGTQLVFGDGDGKIFGSFTKPVDVLGHELTHAVTEDTAGLVYSNEPGALNESMSDVFGICAKQRLLGQTADQADWLIGEGIFLPGVQARALRDMAHPGTAYDDPQLGKDPQVGSYADYVHTTSDNGGVHINSGIPNRAFQLAATGIGGSSAEGAGKIWYAALTGSGVGPNTDFAGFAAATIAAAGPHADVVRQAWTTVGVTPAATAGSGRIGPKHLAPSSIGVRRTGGFAGVTKAGQLDLDGDDPRVEDVRRLVHRTDFSALSSGPAQADAFSYTFFLPEHDEVTVAEDDLTHDLRRLIELLLRDS